MIKLTKKESEIMDIIWKENIPLTATEIQESGTDMSVYSVQQVLQRLLSMEFLKVTGIKQNKKAYARQFAANISESEYISSFINNKETELQLATNCIKHNNDLETILQLEELIKQKREELEKEEQKIVENK